MLRRVEWLTLIIISLVDFKVILHHAAREKSLRKRREECHGTPKDGARKLIYRLDVSITPRDGRKINSKAKFVSSNEHYDDESVSLRRA